MVYNDKFFQAVRFAPSTGSGNGSTTEKETTKKDLVFALVFLLFETRLWQDVIHQDIT